MFWISTESFKRSSTGTLPFRTDSLDKAIGRSFPGYQMQFLL